ncbi:MAG: aspartate--tRNA ligase, partial [Treponema sp.]|nr:aspartate--tRNA ligase [Treponema sp.]
MKRSHTCGELKKTDSGKKVILNGWVHRKRDHGGISFINLRDRYGVTQAVVDPAVFPGGNVPQDLAGITDELRNEFGLAVEGTVRARPDSMVNPEMLTGEIEVLVDKIVILSRSQTLPFQIDEKSDAREELRLKYRYLDLRSQAMQRRIKLRNDVTFAVREFMIGKGFFEIETPTFIRSTPEGARDYVVPSRLYPGKFYALPQSPQLFKQILMVSGFDRYFQIARCYRDEDSRGDRQPEFTQIDIEMSFVDRDDVLATTEGLMAHAFKKGLGLDIPTPFKRLSYQDAMEIYGTDKPDLRFEMTLKDFSPFVTGGDFQAFKDAISGGGAVKALVVPGIIGERKIEFSRKQIDELEAQAKIYRAKGLSWMRVSSGGENGGVALEGGGAKFFASQAAQITSA